MPATTYPPGFVQYDSTNNLETISRFLNTPTLVERELRTLTEQRFIGDVLLTGRAYPSGGAVLYETGESIFADRTPLEAIQPGAEYPLSTVGLSQAQIATVKKWGLDTKITLESVMRQNRNPVDRALTKLANSVIRYVDSLCLTAINAAAINTQAATAAWHSGSSDVLYDLATAEATINQGVLVAGAYQPQGYNADTLVLSPQGYAKLLADKGVQQALQRETPANPIYTGMMGRIVGLDVMVTVNSPDPTSAYVLDRSLLGGIADERPLATNSWYVQEAEYWRLRALRVFTPWVSEPKACVKITGI